MTKKKKIVIIVSACLAALLVIFSVVSFLVVNYYMDMNFYKSVQTKYSASLRYNDVADDCPRYAVEFKSGENTLRGHVYGEQGGKGLLVLSHGIGGGAENYTHIIYYFVKNGWNVLAYDCTGSYSSDGDTTVGLGQSMLDLDAALTFCENNEKLKALPKVLLGHSWGGYAVTSVLNFDHDVKASISFAGYNDQLEMLCEQGRQLIGGFVDVEYPFIWLYNKLKFGDKAEYTAVDGINKSGIPVMLIHGTNDEMISANGAGIIAHKDEITNPDVIYVYRDQPHNSGHNSLFYSKEAREYLDKVNEEYRPLYDKYDGNIPDSELDAFYSKIDKFKVSELDAELFTQILDFCEKAVSE